MNIWFLIELIVNDRVKKYIIYINNISSVFIGNLYILQK